MFFYGKDCNKCAGSGVTEISMVAFVNAAISGLRTENKICAIRDVRQLASDNGLDSGLRECKAFVDAIQAFDRMLRGISDG